MWVTPSFILLPIFLQYHFLLVTKVLLCYLIPSTSFPKLVSPLLETSLCVFLSGCPLRHATLTEKWTSRSKHTECSNSGPPSDGCPGVALLHRSSSALQPRGSVPSSHTTLVMSAAHLAADKGFIMGDYAWG